MRKAGRIQPLPEAVAALVRDGSFVSLEGFTHLIPFAAGHELLRQGLTDLTVVRLTPDVLFDQMIGLGRVERMIFSYGGNPGVGSLHRMRDAVEHGWPRPIELVEHSHAGLANAYVAGAVEPPFGTLRGYAGTDLPEHNDDVAFIDCPFTGEKLTAVRAINPDVAIIHAQQADSRATSSSGGSPGSRRRRCSRPSTRSSPSRRSSTSSTPKPRSVVLPAVGARRRLPRAQRRVAVLRRRLLRARQRLLLRLGCDLARPRPLHAMDGGERPRGGRARRRTGGGTVSAADPTPEEVMTIGAARELVDGEVVLVGVGPPNAAANLARRLDAPGCVLVYESGAIGARPQRLPLSIGDDDLAAGAQDLVSVPEMFNYWIGGGRIDVGFLGASQIDRFGNINTTVIGDYATPKVRLPGAGGAPEIARSAGRVIVLLRHSQRSFVDEVDFVTSVGRELDGANGGPGSAVITDLGILRPSPDDGELELVALHPGVELDDVREATGWDLRVREPLEVTEPVTERELSELRALRVSADED